MANTIRAAVDAFTHYVETRDGRPSDEISLPPRLVFYYLNMFRNKLSFDKIKKTGDGSANLGTVLTLPCVKLEKVSITSECPCVPNIGCTWNRSVSPLPKFIGGKPISVTTVEGGLTKTTVPHGVVDFEYVPWDRASVKMRGRMAAQANEPIYTFRTTTKGFRLYVYANTTLKDLEVVAVNGVPVDPIDFLEFPICGESNEICEPLEEAFILEADLQHLVYEMTYKTLFDMKKVAPGADVINNDNNDATAPLPPSV